MVRYKIQTANQFAIGLARLSVDGTKPLRWVVQNRAAEQLNSLQLVLWAKNVRPQKLFLKYRFDSDYRCDHPNLTRTPALAHPFITYHIICVLCNYVPDVHDCPGCWRTDSDTFVRTRFGWFASGYRRRWPRYLWWWH